MAAGEDWSGYYDAAGEDPRETLLEALRRFGDGGNGRFAVDLGCGTGRDTAELLRLGWTVLAIDGQTDAIERLRRRPDLPADFARRLRTQVARFEDAHWPETDLVNSSFALPFCPPDMFPRLWRRIVDSLRPGGRFCGHLFGDRDGWAGESDMTFLTRAQVEELLEPLDAEQLDEIEEDGTTARGDAKHWHLFNVVARKTG